MDGCSDGTFPHTGQKFFNCPPGKGLYYPLKNVQPDERYAPEVATDGNRETSHSDACTSSVYIYFVHTQH